MPPQSHGAETPVLHQGIHWRAWAPFIAILIAIPVALLLLHLSQVSMINFIMLVGRSDGNRPCTFSSAGTGIVAGSQTRRPDHL